MKVKIGNQLRITEPTEEVMDWCKEHLVLGNPDYVKKQRMGFWVGNTPKHLYLYETDGKDYVVPFGCLRELMPYILDAEVESEFAPATSVEYEGNVPLYDYQSEAVNKMILNHYGILQSPAGSGKTQMGIAIAGLMGLKTLWVTHTKDLLTQSKRRAEIYYDKSLMGTITEGKVSIGEGITFATVQTLSALDLDLYKDTWDCIIVDECHRVAGTPTSVTQFSKVLNSLRARHKYGLSATVHRSDGLIEATYALLGRVVYTVSADAVKDKVMPVHIQPVSTDCGMSREFLNSDGTINYARMITYLAENEDRNELIASRLAESRDHFNLVLSDRLEHLERLMAMLPDDLKEQAVFISGKMSTKAGKAKREKAIEDMRQGKKRYLFASYSLAKEGLDIPRLDRLFMVTPQKDYAVIVQSTGRVARTFEGKGQPIVYDFVDPMRLTINAYKRRCTTYKKCGYEVLEDE